MLQRCESLESTCDIEPEGVGGSEDYSNSGLPITFLILKPSSQPSSWCSGLLCWGISPFTIRPSPTMTTNQSLLGFRTVLLEFAKILGPWALRRRHGYWIRVNGGHSRASRYPNFRIWRHLSRLNVLDVSKK